MSEKIMIMTDSNAGITQEEGDKYGVYVLPMPFLIDGNSYFEDINLTQAEFYKKLQSDADILTSQPAVGDILDKWNEILKDYDSIVHIPMSSGLSNSCATAKMLSEDFDGRVQVVDNQRISVTQRQSMLDAIELAKEGYSAKQIKEKLEEVKLESSIYIMLDTLKYLKKGGRVTPAAAAVATVLRIKPVLQIQGEKLDAFSKARSIPLGKEIMLNAIEKDIAERFGGDNSKINFAVAHTENYDEAEKFRLEIMERFGVTDVHIAPLSLSVSCHIGPGSLAVAISKKVGY